MEWRKTTPVKEKQTTFAISHSTYSEIFLYMETGIMIVVTFEVHFLKQVFYG